MKLTLRLITGELIESTINESPIVIGRSRRCQIVVPHEGVSRQHIMIEVINGDVFVTDLGSTNGVNIDGVRIPANEKKLFQTFRALSFGAVESLQIEFEMSEASRIMQNPLGKYSTTQVYTGGGETQMTRVEALNLKKPATAQGNTAGDLTRTQMKALKKKTQAKNRKESKENFPRIVMNVIVIGFLLLVTWYFYDRHQTEKRQNEAAPKVKEDKKKESSAQYL